MTTPLRPLTLGELLDRIFFLYRTHFVVFAGIVALPNLVLLAVQLMMIVARDSGSVAGYFVFVLVLLVTGVVVGAVSQAATVIALSNVYLNRRVTIADAFAAIKGRIGELCVIVIGLGIGVGIGLLFLVIPGIYLALRWSVAVPVAVLEHAGLRDAMTRSGELTKGSLGRIFVVYVLYIVLLVTVSSVWNIPVMIGAVLAGVRPDTPMLWTRVLLQAGNFVTQTLVGPLLTIALALVYYDLRVRKEAFDLEHMMAELDRPGGEPATAT